MNKQLRGGGNAAPLKYLVVSTIFFLIMLFITQLTLMPFGNNQTLNGGDIILKPVIENGVTLDVATVSEENGVSKVLTATVKPDTAVNKLVDWTIEWNEATENVESPVTDFVTLTTESDGSNVATLTCKKAFGNDTIIVTVTTRAGGHTATCLVKFVGVSFEIATLSGGVVESYTEERGSFYELGTNGSYTFTFNQIKTFDTVTTDISISVGAYGNVWFGTGSYNDAGAINYTDYTQKELNSIADCFIKSATLSDNVLTIKTGSKTLLNYYSEKTTDELYNEFYKDMYVKETNDTFDGYKESGDTFNNSKAEENANALSHCCFYVTILDNISGVFETIKLWVVEATGSVALSDEIVEF